MESKNSPIQLEVINMSTLKYLTKIYQANARANNQLAKSIMRLTIFMPLFYLILFVILPILIVITTH